MPQLMSLASLGCSCPFYSSNPSFWTWPCDPHILLLSLPSWVLFVLTSFLSPFPSLKVICFPFIHRVHVTVHYYIPDTLLGIQRQLAPCLQRDYSPMEGGGEIQVNQGYSITWKAPRQREGLGVVRAPGNGKGNQMGALNQISLGNEEKGWTF